MKLILIEKRVLLTPSCDHAVTINMATIAIIKI